MSKILIVDDEKKIRDIYRKLLTLEGYDVFEAEDVPAATRFLVNDEGIKLVLLDINIPQVDGGILYRLIRMLDAKIKVIVTSAYPLEDQKQKIIKADDYYDKSQGMDLLLEKVKNQVTEEEQHEFS